jgi:hypothetical protein
MEVGSTWPSQWMRGPLELCVLALVADQATYGYAIVQRLEAAGFGRIKGGTLSSRGWRALPPIRRRLTARSSTTPTDANLTEPS